MKKVILAGAISVASILNMYAAGEQIGKINGVTNGEGVTIIRDGKEVPVSMMKPIFLNDTIRTSDSSSVYILLNDNSIFALSPNTDLTVDKFVFDSNDAELNVKVKTGLVAGITGDIVKKNPDKFKVSTPKSILGIRGTTFFTDVADDKPETSGVINIDGGHALSVNGHDLTKNLTAVEVTKPNQQDVKEVPVPATVLTSIADTVPLESDKSQLTYLVSYDGRSSVYQSAVKSDGTVKSACSNEPAYFQASGKNDKFAIYTYADNTCGKPTDAVALTLTKSGGKIVNRVNVPKFTEKEFPFYVKEAKNSYNSLRIGKLVEGQVGVYEVEATGVNAESLYGFIKVDLNYVNSDALEASGDIYLSPAKKVYSDKLFKGQTYRPLNKTKASTFSNARFVIDTASK